MTCLTVPLMLCVVCLYFAIRSHTRGRLFPIPVAEFVRHPLDTGGIAKHKRTTNNINGIVKQVMHNTTRTQTNSITNNKHIDVECLSCRMTYRVFVKHL